MTPKVSVCIPTYNTARYLGEAIESVIAQSYSDFELIVCDNASTDETPEICARYAAEPRFRCYRFEELVGQGGNWNRSVARARGEYVALLHSDDRYLPGFLADRVRVLESDRGVGLAFGAVRLIDPEGRPAGEQRFRHEDLAVPAPEFFGELLMGCVISPVSPVVRRECYEAVGPFSEKRLWGIDWEMWLRLAAIAGVAYSAATAAEYRIHGGSGSTAGLLQSRYGTEDTEVLEEAFRWMEERPDLRRFLPLRVAALRKQALRAAYAAGYNCEQGNRDGTRANLRWMLKADRKMALRPTVWALWLSCYLGPWVYTGFSRLRNVSAGP